MKQRHAHWLIAALVCCPCALALNPSLNISQYSHAAWRTSEGFPRGMVRAIAQTPDGYLWLATDSSLLRFDGVRRVRWEELTSQTLPDSNITSLLAAHDGTLWIGTGKGLASWKNSKLTRYPRLDGTIATTLLEDHEGSVWASGRAIPNGKLCRFQDGRIRCYGEDGSLGSGVLSLYEFEGAVWAAGLAGRLLRCQSDQLTFLPFPIPEVRDMITGNDSALWLAARGGVRKFGNGKDEGIVLPVRGGYNPNKLLRDREGGLWIGTSSQGLLHQHQGTVDAFTPADGLSGFQVSEIFEDREGNIWVATSEGLDRFRDIAVPTLSSRQGLSTATVGSVLAARDGAVWIGTFDGLNRWNHGQLTIYRKQRSTRPVPADPQPFVREVYDNGLPDSAIQSLLEDDQHRIWVSTLHGVAYYEGGRFTPMAVAPSPAARAMVEQPAGTIWIADQNRGLLRFLDGRAESIPWTGLGRADFATALAADPTQKGLWLGFFQGGLAHFQDGQFTHSYHADNGLGAGRVNRIRFDQSGALWAATEGGLSRLKDGRITTLTSRNGLPCDAVQWSIEDNAQSVWLNQPCGLISLPRAELEAWTADPNRKVSGTVFESSDGLRSRATVPGYGPQVTRSPDGRLWFVTPAGVSVIDPLHLPVNTLPPPVHVEQITVNRQPRELTSDANGPLRLPPLVRELQIDYTALSVVAPEKVRFRYKLEGHDNEWADAGNRRQAFYNDLPPRKYRFRVIACNNSGRWNETGASLDFSIAPAYYQTTWFQASASAAVLVLLVMLYRIRVRFMARQFNLRLEERVNERSRIARDLHDTLLQSFQGVLLKFHAVGYMIPDRPEARNALQSAIEQARTAITEGRDAVSGLRSASVGSHDLTQAIGTLAGQIAADCGDENRPEFEMRIEGQPRELTPLVRHEVFLVATEVLRNAFRHAQASRIEVEVRYDRRQFRMRLRDNGKGIDSGILESGRAGHHGLPGIHERATLLGGTLSVWSERSSGTEIELVLRASVAYVRSQRKRLWKFAGKGNQ